MKKTFTYLLMVAGLFLFAFSANAQVTVTNSNDAGAGSFRQAVLDVAADGAILFDASLDGTTITLLSEVTINKNIIINGNGAANTTFSGGGTTRIFNITSGDVTINGVTLRNGFALDNGGAISASGATVMINNSTISNNTATGIAATNGGGGIFLANGTLTLNVSTVSNNTANGAAGSGGGIHVSTGGTLNVNGSTISDNSATRAGGGIEVNAATAVTVTLEGTTLEGNTTGAAPGNGGGLHITGASNATINGGIVRNNTAASEGGGLWNGSGTMAITGTLITENTASGAAADQGGGGIYNQSGTLNVLAETTITNNNATGTSGSGGGILNDVGGKLTVNGALIRGNTSNRAGGGIEDNAGATGFVTLINVTLDENTTNTNPGNGGGLHVTGAGVVEITGGTVSGNEAGAEGGGLWNGSGTMTIEGTAIANNTASGDLADQGGGGIYNLSGTVTIDAETEITGNTADGAAGSGGGILNDVGGKVTINGASITANVSNRAGGGIEDNGGANGFVKLTDVTLDGNTTNTSPGNGGGLHVTGAGMVTITGGTVSDNEAGAEGGGLWNGSGTMTISGTVIADNTAAGAGADQGGGGIYNLSGTLNLSGDVVISGNTATGAAGSGGGLLNDVGGKVTIENTTFTANTSVRAGGAIEDNGRDTGFVTIDNVTFTGNNAGNTPGYGGAVHMTANGNVNITNSIVSGNTAVQGGGLWIGTGIMDIERVHIAANTATGLAATDGGGGIYNTGGTLNVAASTLSLNTASGLLGRGGGLHLNGGTTTMLTSTVSGNSSLTNGGGIYNNSTLTINANTIALNTSAINGGGISNEGTNTVNLKNTLISSNTALSGANLLGADGSFTSNGFNLVAFVDADVFVATDDYIIGSTLAPILVSLNALAEVEDGTPVHTLGCPSIAADMGSPDDNFNDQNGMAVFNGRRDIGAFEAQEVCSTASTGDFAIAKSMVYPNPSNGVFTLDLANNHNANANISIYEIATGKLVKQMTASTMNVEIGMSGFAGGTYVMQIVSDNASETHKLIVNK